VTVLYRGKEWAKLTPTGPTTGSAPAKTTEQPLFGLCKDREDMRDPASYLRQLRLPRRAAGAPNIKKQSRARKPK
jgi:hypothetical protein